MNDSEMVETAVSVALLKADPPWRQLLRMTYRMFVVGSLIYLDVHLYRLDQLLSALDRMLTP
jgi:hypothetical protein